MKETDPHKMVILLVNKADFLSTELLQHWRDYFTEKKINFYFFSAKREQSILDGEEVKADPNSMLLSRVQLLQNLKELVKERFGLGKKPEAGEEEKLPTIGMVGYPNVGKSSVINVICGKKEVLREA